jgi:flavodoxin
MNALVIYYSRTGNTQVLAQRIGGALDARLEEITDRAHRRGILGYLRSGREAWFGQRAELMPCEFDLSAFDLVVIGTPVWNASLSSPVRTFLEDNAKALRSVAFFCTMGGRGSKRVFRQMEAACRKPPIATLARTERQLARSDLPDVVGAFVAQLRAALVPELVRGPAENTRATRT